MKTDIKIEIDQKSKIDTSKKQTPASKIKILEQSGESRENYNAIEMTKQIEDAKSGKKSSNGQRQLRSQVGEASSNKKVVLKKS
jgi:hypothetical protein